MMLSPLRYLVLFTTIAVVSCNDPKEISDIKCPPGYRLGGIDSTECIEVVCPPGYQLGGVDSSECVEIVCPPGYQSGGIDSTECIQIVCPPGFYLGGPDSTECTELICESYHSQCDSNLQTCCPDTVNYFPLSVGNTWTYNVNYHSSGYHWGNDIGGTEIWEIIWVSENRSRCGIGTVFSGLLISENWEADGQMYGYDTTRYDTIQSSATISFSDNYFDVVDQGSGINFIDLYTGVPLNWRPLTIREFSGESVSDTIPGSSWSSEYSININQGFLHMSVWDGDGYGSRRTTMNLLEFQVVQND